jgi:hypothetical protein
VRPGAVLPREAADVGAHAGHGEEELVAAGGERALADQSSSVGAQLLGGSPQALGDLGAGELSAVGLELGNCGEVLAFTGEA